jgi:hypothetical protein
MEWTSVIK